MLVREMFIRVFFIRTFVLDDLLKQARSNHSLPPTLWASDDHDAYVSSCPACWSVQTRQLVVTYESNPNNIAEIRSRLNDASRDIISLEALLEYLKESLENLKIPPPPRDKDGCVRQAAAYN